MKSYQILILIVTLAVIGCQDATETVEILDDAGNLREKFQLRKADGLKVGAYEKYDETGKIIELANYKEGKLEGKRTVFYVNEAPAEEEFYENGLLTGNVISYYSDGTKKAITPFVVKGDHSVMQGKLQVFYENGQLKSEDTAKNSEINGPFVEYHPNGKMKAKGTFKPDADGEPRENGLLEIYDETGALDRKMNCVMGRCTTIDNE
jgi:antitoxin component YwqK of YwqJK toxin-antitoxin module